MRRLLLAVAATLIAARAVAAPFTMAAPTRATLPCGLRVILVPSARLPLVDLRLVVRAGAVNDPAGKEGLAALTATLLTQGAGARDAQAVAEEIAFVGGSLEASGGLEQTIVTCEVLSKDLPTGIGLVSDVAVRPTFPAAEFDRKKSEALAQIASDKDSPESIADNALAPFLWGGESPLGHPAIGWESSVGTLTHEDVVAFHRTMITPDNAFLVVVGDIQPKAVLAQLAKAFAGWRAGGRAAAVPYAPGHDAEGHAIRVIEKPEVTQTQVRLARMGVPRTAPDFYAIQVANAILGGGFTSRLVNDLRVNKGLTYGVSSRLAMYRNAGSFVINTFTKNETIRQIVDAAFAVTDSLVAAGPSDEEVAKAKRFLTGQFPLDLQAPDDLAAQVAAVEFYGLPADYITGYTARVNAVTPADVRRALAAHFGTGSMKILVVSNPDTARAALAGLGAIEVQPIP